MLSGGVSSAEVLGPSGDADDADSVAPYWPGAAAPSSAALMMDCPRSARDGAGHSPPSTHCDGPAPTDDISLPAGPTVPRRDGPEPRRDAATPYRCGQCN